MELRHLASFRAAAQTLHFGEAARRRHITQPALSRHIQKLEEDLGVLLFDRSGHTVVLTAAGAAFQKEAARVMSRVERAAETARHVAQGLAGRLRIGFVGSTTYDVLPELLKHQHTAAGDVHLELREMVTTEQLEAIAAGDLDLGLVRPPLYGHPALSTQTIQEESIVAVLPLQHRLAGQAAVLPSAFADEPFILLPRGTGPGLYDRIIALCQEAGFSPRVVQEAVLVQTIIGLVAGGLGVAFVPACVQQVARKDVVYCRLQDTKVTTELAAVWDAENGNPALATLLRSLETISLVQ